MTTHRVPTYAGEFIKHKILEHIQQYTLFQMIL